MSIRGDRGAVAAEFAVVVPAVVLVVLLVVATLSASALQVRLEQAAGQGARLAARGESEARVRDVAGSFVAGASVAVRREGEFVCVEVRKASHAPLPLPALRAVGCALEGGL